MSKIVVKKIEGMNLWARFALIAMCTLLASTLMSEPTLALNSIMHNSSSATVGSSRYGSWGLEKDCSWCHSASSTANIKKISGQIDTPDGPRSVVFYRMTASFNNASGVMGNDARTYSVSSSTNVCEVCHRQTAFHQYSSEKVAGANHYDNQQCTSCHMHADGFRPNRHVVPYYADSGGGHRTCSTATGCHANSNPAAVYPTAGTAPDCRSCHVNGDPTDVANGCGSCHGVAGGTGQPSGATHPDVAGSHAAHMALNGVSCADCHTAGGPGGKVDHGKGNRGANPAIVNLNDTFTWNSGTATCSTASCHANPYQYDTIDSPAWGTAVGCQACHNASTRPFLANGAPDTGSHVKHLSLPGASCGQCHAGAVKDVSGGSTHPNDSVDVLNGYPLTAKHDPATFTGTCSTAACHASAYDTSLVETPVWGTTAGCAACHMGGGAFAVNGAPNTGSHPAHMALAGAACGQCHEGAVKDASGGLSHDNGVIDVANDYSASPVVKHTAGTYTGYCMSAACHANPYGVGAVNSPVWGATTGCASCHVGEGAFAGNGAPATGSHAKHMALNNAACNACHVGAVSGVNPGSYHANGFVNVTSGYTAKNVLRHPVGTYAGTCANSCHNNGSGTGVASPKWGLAIAADCTGCHGGSSSAPTAKIIATGKHRAHINNYSTLGKANNLMCAECHAKTVSLASNTAITGSANHLNSYKDYSGARAGGSNNYALATGVCSTVYCHSNGQSTPRYMNMTGSKAWSGSGKLGCSSCHGNEPGASFTTNFGAPNYPNKYDGTMATANSHERHTLISGATDSTACAKCHVKTVDRSVASKLRDYSSAHLNRQADISFAIYGIYSSNSKGCTTYCHSNVQAPGGASEATQYAKPVWGTSTMTCASCHRNMATLAETAEDLQYGSHKRHTVDAGYACSACHGPAYSASNADVTTHANGSIDVSFTGSRAAGTTYSQTGSNLPGDTYGTCSTSKCHGRATRNWGISTTATECEKCHGSARTAQVDGVFKDTAGSPASPYVGTHVSHLAGTHNLTAPLQCVECHTVPSSINSFDHMSSLPARLKFGVLASRSSVVRAGSAGDSGSMNPTYSNDSSRTCSNTYCHAGVKIKDINTGIITYQGSKPNPTWADAGYLGGTGCSMCHGYPPKGLHTASTNCSACHASIDQSNIAIADKNKHINGKVETTADDCLSCHSSSCAPGDNSCISKELVGGHKTHTNSELFLAGKKLSTGDYIDPSWIYGITYKKGFPQYACGFCHPMNSASHKNGLVEIDLDPSHALRGSVKTKNKAGGPWVVAYQAGESVMCNNVYCHSSGFVSETTQAYQFKQTPDWYYADHNGGTSAWASVDKCAQCHGNSPNTGGTEGSSAHARHVVANHYKDVFDNYSGKLAPAGAPGTGVVHGDPKTATTLSCNICHFDTVRDAHNDKGTACSSCHSTAGKGTMDIFSSSTKHVNGDVDVAFMQPFNFKSKAQLRDKISSVQSIYTSWTRVSGYKTYSSYDLARRAPVYSTGTCSTTACHNGTLMEWRTKGPLACAACHTGLPQ